MAFSISGIGGSLASMGGMFGLIFEYALIFGVVAAVIYFFWWYKKFNVIVELQAVRASTTEPDKKGFKIFMDRGGYFGKKGQYEEFRLLKDKGKLKPPDDHYLYPTKKGNKLYLRKYGPGNYIPLLIGDVVMHDNSGTILRFVGEDQDIVNWSILQMLRNIQVYGKENWLAKYGSYMLFGVAVVGCIVLMYLMIQNVGSIIPALDRMTAQLASVVKANGAQLIPVK